MEILNKVISVTIVPVPHTILGSRCANCQDPFWKECLLTAALDAGVVFFRNDLRMFQNASSSVEINTGSSRNGTFLS